MDELMRRVREALQDGFRPAAGSRWALKPNLSSERPADQGAVTDVRLAEAVLAHLRDHRAGACLVELPPHVRNVERVFGRSGYADLARRFGVPLVDPERVGGFAPVGALLPGVPLRVARSALEADGILNLPKLKTHCRAGFSGAVKNLMGLTDMRTRHRMHVLGLGPTVAALYRALASRIGLNVADATVVMEGNGPTRGDPVRLDCVVMGPASALDRDAISRLGLRRSSVPYLRYLPAEAVAQAVAQTVAAPAAPALPVLRPAPAPGLLRGYLKEALITQPLVRRLLQRLDLDPRIHLRSPPLRGRPGPG
jgi:uncharacterized protein (DUF362 family)